MRHESERQRRLRMQVSYSCAIALLVFAALVSLGAYQIRRMFHDAVVDDFEKRTPEFGYRYLFQQPTPPDVIGFRAFGYSAFAGAECGATFHANPATIRALTRGMAPIPSREVDDSWGAAFADEMHFQGVTLPIPSKLQGSWTGWTGGGSGDYKCLFWNPQQREAWYYYWSQ